MGRCTNRMLATGPAQNPQPHDIYKRADEWESKEFASYGKFCHQISLHTMMKSPSFDRELEVLQGSDCWPALNRLGGTQNSDPTDSTDESCTATEIRTTHFDVYYGCFVENSLLSLRKVMRLGHYFHTNVLLKGLGQTSFECSV